MPVVYKGVLGSRNRLNKMKIALYHRLPTIILPIISSKDVELIRVLFANAHIEKQGVHLNKGLTIMKLRTGFYGCHIPNMSKIVKKLIEDCVTCKKRQWTFAKSQSVTSLEPGLQLLKMESSILWNRYFGSLPLLKWTTD